MCIMSIAFLLTTPPRQRRDAYAPSVRTNAWGSTRYDHRGRTKRQRDGLGGLNTTTWVMIVTFFFMASIPFHFGRHTLQRLRLKTSHALQSLSPKPPKPSETMTQDERPSTIVPNTSRRSEPPSYLPLAQHLKNINGQKKRPSLRDMVYGSQRRSLPDLKGTNNKDLKKCARCVLNSIQLSAEEIPSEKQLKLGRTLMTLVRFYNVSSMVMMPCISEGEWIFSVVKALRDVDSHFTFYCGVSKGFDVNDLTNIPGSPDMSGTNFIVYRPLSESNIPKADLFFTWRGLEKHGLDEIHNIFKQVVQRKIKYTLIGNSPGMANAKLIETESGTYSIVRPEKLALNVRAYPFGLNAAERVVLLNDRQLLLYKSANMRDGW